MIKKEDLNREIVKGVAFYIPLVPLRETPDVLFHDLPLGFISEIDAVDRVEHAEGAKSPVAKNAPDIRAWYMHPDQEDNLLVLKGERHIDLYTLEHGRVEHFDADSHSIKHNGVEIHSGPAILGWGVNVFHRVLSPNGSTSINFARHFENFSIESNFNIYDLDTDTGIYSLLREGKEDQPTIEIGE